MSNDVYFAALGLGAGDPGGRGIVVVDVLRATTTIVTALANGAKAVIPAATSEEAVRLASNLEKDGVVLAGDRKSTRLNSSHRCISYAVFCLKKKKNQTDR